MCAARRECVSSSGICGVSDYRHYLLTYWQIGASAVALAVKVFSEQLQVSAL